MGSNRCITHFKIDEYGGREEAGDFELDEVDRAAILSSLQQHGTGLERVDISLTDDDLIRDLKPVLSGMHTIRSLSWHCELHDEDPSPTNTLLWMTSLPQLRELQVFSCYPQEMQELLLSPSMERLETLFVRFPDAYGDSEEPTITTNSIVEN